MSVYKKIHPIAKNAPDGLFQFQNDILNNLSAAFSVSEVKQWMRERLQWHNDHHPECELMMMFGTSSRMNVTIFTVSRRDGKQTQIATITASDQHISVDERGGDDQG